MLILLIFLYRFSLIFGYVMFLDSVLLFCNFSCFNFRSFVQILEHILQIRREKAKQEFWQTVGNQLATIWHCEIGIANLALRNWLCEIRKPQFTIHLSHKNVKNLSEISHCQIRNVVCEIRNSLANFASALRNSQPCEQIAN